MNFVYITIILLQRSLATDLQNLSMELRKKQSTYLKRLRQQKEVWQECNFSFQLLSEPKLTYPREQERSRETVSISTCYSILDHLLFFYFLALGIVLLHVFNPA